MVAAMQCSGITLDVKLDVVKQNKSGERVDVAHYLCLPPTRAGKTARHDARKQVMPFG